MSVDEMFTGAVVAVVNLPHREKLVRRYICTYESPFVFFPPHDLLQLASCIREWTNTKVVFLDAIAENSSESQVIDFLRQHQPLFMVTLLGVESVETDLGTASRLHAAVPSMNVIVFGYYASLYPKEILDNSNVDAVLMGDPEESCCSYINAVLNSKGVAALPGVACRNKDRQIFINQPTFLSSLNLLPFPDYGMVPLTRYNDMLLGGPFATIQTSRGCRFHCSYCTSPQHGRVLLRTAESVAEEMENLMQRGVKVIRFLDDTFTGNKQRAISICQEILRRNIKVHWSCLSRVDTLDTDSLVWMKRAGCVRVIVGVESYAPRVLQVYNKRINPDTINTQISLINQVGIESMAFIITGGPFESEEDFEMTRKGLLASPLNLVAISSISIYGGTPLAEKYRENIEYSIFPYISRWRDTNIDTIALKRKHLLYRQFYSHPKIIWHQIFNIIRFPIVYIKLIFFLFNFLLDSIKKMIYNKQ